MYRNIVLIFFFFFLTKYSLLAQEVSNKPIVYVMPKTVSDIAYNYINNFDKKNKKLSFFTLLSLDVNGNFSLFITNYDSASIDKDLILFRTGLINKTNRVIILKDKRKIPLIFDLDLEFAVLEERVLKDGRIMRSSNRFVNDSFVIKFDKYGKIK